MKTQGFVPKLYQPFFKSLAEKAKALNEVPETRLPEDINEVMENLRLQKSIEFSCQKGFFWPCLLALKAYCRKSIFAGLLVGFASLGSAFSAMQVLREGVAVGESLFFAALFFLFSGLSLLGAYSLNLNRMLASTYLSGVLSTVILQKIATLSRKDRNKFSNGSLKVFLTSDAERVSMFFDNLLRNAVPALVIILVLTPAAWIMARWAGIAGIITAMLFIPITLILGQFSTFFEHKVQNQKDVVTNILSEWLYHTRVIRYLGWEKQLAREIDKSIGRLLQFAAAGHVFVCGLFGLAFTWWIMSCATIYVVAYLLKLNLTPRVLFGSTWIIMFACKYLAHVSATIKFWSEARPSGARLREFFIGIEAKHSIADTPYPNKEPVALHLTDVSVIADEKIILSHLNVRLSLFERTAVIGAVGAGKSTLIKLLVGIIPPTSGKYEVEWADGSRSDFWESTTFSHVRTLFSWVPQEAFISQAALVENITLERYSKTDEEDANAWKALEFAELNAEVAGWKDSLLTEIGEHGINLSGGQQQRTNIARSFYAQRKYSFFDDPLSALDPGAEVRIVENIIASDVKGLLVSHRVKELVHMDRIITLENGVIIEDGLPMELLNKIQSSFCCMFNAYKEE